MSNVYWQLAMMKQNIKLHISSNKFLDRLRAPKAATSTANITDIIFSATVRFLKKDSVLIIWQIIMVFQHSNVKTLLEY